MGLYVVGRLAQRHGIRVQLRERPYGGITANVITPGRLVRTGPDAQPRPVRRPATRPQPVVPPNGPRLTAVRSPSPAPAAPPRPAPPTPSGPDAQGAPPQRERPVPPPAAAPDQPMAPPAPRFAPADPSSLPQRTPSRGSTASPPPSPPPASPQPPAGQPETEAPTARADRIRDDLADFRLGQREAQAADPAATPGLPHSDEFGRQNAEPGEGPGAANGKPVRPGGADTGSQAGPEAGST